MDWFPPLFRRSVSDAPSRFAAFSGYLYTMLVVGVSLYPFQGWQSSADHFGAFLFYPWPRYFTSFDVFINVAAYIPLGIIIVTASRQRLTVVGGLLLAMFGGSALSLLLELCQQYLPARIPSKLDWACNSAGALLGGSLVLLLHRHPVWRRFRMWRQHWLHSDTLSDFGLAVIALWFFSQLDPAVPLFGVVVRPQGLPQPFVSPLQDPALFLTLLEGAGAFLHLVGVGWLVATIMRRARHGLGAVYGFFGLAILVKLLFAGMLLLPSAYFEWINGAVACGWLLGLLVFYVFRNLKRVWQASLAVVALLGSKVVGDLWPLHATPMGDLQLFKWSFGQLGHFKGLVGLVSALWPYLALVYLLWLIVVLLRRNPNDLLG